MKNNIKIKFKHVFLLLALLVMSISCDDLVDEQPISEIGPENFWKTPGDAEAGLAGVYDGIQKTFRENHYYWGELRSDNFWRGSESASANRLELVYNDITSGNNIYRWNNLYNLINRVNLAVKYMPDITGINPNLIAEAHAIRAFTYFHAVRVWGSVPLFTEPIESSTQDIQKTRTDGATILNEVIIPDMLAAEALMENPQDDYRFSESSIWCLQAEVYMYLKDYTNAKIALDKLVALNEFSLVTSVTDWQNLFLNDINANDRPSEVFTDGSEMDLWATGKIQSGSELILSINYDLLDSDRAGIFSIYFAGLPAFYMSPVIENKWIEKFPIDSTGWVNKYPGIEPKLQRQIIYVDENGAIQDSLAPVYGDWRYFLSREDDINFESTPLGEARLSKYNKSNYSNNFDDSDIVLYRYSDMLLLLAEAENRLGNVNVALDLVNDVRTARELPAVTLVEFGATIDQRENFILDERQLELLGEGKRWWDLMRTGKTLEVMNPILDTLPSAVQLTTDRVFSPIFDEHLIENPQLMQSPGY